MACGDITGLLTAPTAEKIKGMTMFGTVGVGSVPDKAMMGKSEIPQSASRFCFPAGVVPAQTRGLGSRILLDFPATFPPVWETTCLSLQDVTKSLPPLPFPTDYSRSRLTDTS